MLLRNSLLIAGLASFVACTPSTSNGKNDGGTDAGTSTKTDGGGSTGSDGGTDAGTTTTPRTVTIEQARSATFCTDYIKLQGVVVTAVDDTFKGSAGDFTAQFWVTDPANPELGLYVDKYFTDAPGTYEPKVGDVLDITGYLQSVKKFEDREAYRLVLKSQFGCAQPNTGKLTITQTGTTSPLADNMAPSGFGDSQGGTVKANAEYAGGRVYIQGPLELTNANPSALKRISANENDSVHFGFEVTGGILVNNYKTYGVTQDGGTERCDWRAIASDGGTVTFPNGIRGVWDTFSHAPCSDGGTASGCFRDAGVVPGTDQNYTYVLYPQDCATDLAGEAQ